MNQWILIASVLVGCQEYRSASVQEGCHYVSCGDLIDGFDEPRCVVIVDNRMIFNTPSGQEALDFIKRNELRTCEKKQ